MIKVLNIEGLDQFVVRVNGVKITAKVEGPK
jgi:hypothetical protein